MSRLMKRSGMVLGSVILTWSTGCGQSSTEVPLANVAPVTVTPDSAKLKPKAGAIVSPPHIEGHN